jgi:hypothetical protein
MKKLLFPVFLVLTTVIFITSCYNDKEAYLYPFGSICDSTNVTYTQTIAPIMSSNCNTCHNSAQALGGVITDTYTGLSVVALNGQLWAGVNWSAGFSPMPKGGAQLSACDRAKIKKWINNGSPNN